MGKRIIISRTPFATLQWWAVILLPPSGAFPCCILSPRALPGAGISMPLWGVTNTHPPPLPKGGGTDTHPFIYDRRTKEHETPSLREGRGGLPSSLREGWGGLPSSLRKGYGFLLMQANKVRAGELCSGNRRSRFACRRMEPGWASPKLWLPRCIAWLTAQKAKQVVLVCNKGLIAMQ